jgi:hypothetical protein
MKQSLHFWKNSFRLVSPFTVGLFASDGDVLNPYD